MTKSELLRTKKSFESAGSLAFSTLLGNSVMHASPCLYTKLTSSPLLPNLAT